jgi:hypothetical protein
LSQTQGDGDNRLSRCRLLRNKFEASHHVIAKQRILPVLNVIRQRPPGSHHMCAPKRGLQKLQARCRGAGYLAHNDMEVQTLLVVAVGNQLGEKVT